VYALLDLALALTLTAIPISISLSLTLTLTLTHEGKLRVRTPNTAGWAHAVAAGGRGAALGLARLGSTVSGSALPKRVAICPYPIRSSNARRHRCCAQ